MIQHAGVSQSNDPTEILWVLLNQERLKKEIKRKREEVHLMAFFSLFVSLWNTKVEGVSLRL